MLGPFGVSAIAPPSFGLNSNTNRAAFCFHSLSKSYEKKKKEQNIRQKIDIVFCHKLAARDLLVKVGYLYPSFYPIV